MKKVIVLLVIVMIVGVFVSGCRKSIGDRIAEGIVEDITGGEVDISGDGEDVTIETEDGSFSVGESMDWPGGSMADLPKPNATITGVMDAGEDGCTVVFTDMSKGDSDKYMEDIKAKGYTEDSMNMSDADGIWYVGSNQNGAVVTFTYTNESGEGMVAYTAPSEE